MDIFIKENDQEKGLTEDQIRTALNLSLKGKRLKKVLLIPPDFTRLHSNAGLITNIYYHLLKDKAQVFILPALGTHEAMTKEECNEMFGDIPYEKFVYHNWRNDVMKVGEVPLQFVSEISNNLWNYPISCEVNRLIMDESFDLIISIGQVVPHEVIGMANHAKNLFVGCGGSQIINQSHMLGAVFGMEKIMGKDHSPVRKVLDYGMEHFLKNRPILFVLTVTSAPKGIIHTHGLFIGEKRNTLEEAIKLSQEKNIIYVDKPIKKCIVYLDPKEFKSTWLGNKAIYRTRMALDDGGELIILSPGVKKFGEDLKNDQIIRKYGYCGRLKVLSLFQEQEDLRNNMGTAAHLIHGSSDGRFSITYAIKEISKEEIERVHFKSALFEEMILKYPIESLKPGWNILNGEEIYYIPNPALGLWIYNK